MAENETSDETTTTEEEESATPGAPSMTNPLSKPTDAVARPGFRNPANKGSKAMKKKRRKKKR